MIGAEPPPDPGEVISVGTAEPGSVTVIPISIWPPGLTDPLGSPSRAYAVPSGSAIATAASSTHRLADAPSALRLVRRSTQEANDDPTPSEGAAQSTSSLRGGGRSHSDPRRHR